MLRARLLTPLVLLIGLAAPARAGTPYQDIIRQVTRFNGSQLAYDYTVRLLDEKGFQLDTLKGRLYRDGRNYVDSSAAAYVVLKDRYYFKLNFDAKTATLYNLNAIQQKLRLQWEDHAQSGWFISDSLIASAGDLTVDTTHQDYYLLSWKMAKSNIARFQMTVTRTTYQLIGAAIAFRERDPLDPSKQMQRVLELRNIRHAVPPAVFQTDRFYKVSPSGAALSPRYGHYRLQTLL